MNTREIAKEYRLQHWAGIMAERTASRTSIKAYCRAAGICENVYYYWQRKLREAACENHMPSVSSEAHRDFMPRVSDNAGKAIIPNGWAMCEENGATESSTGTVSIEIGKCRINAGPGVSAEALEKICRVLLRLC